MCKLGKKLQQIADKAPEHADFLLNAVFSTFEELSTSRDENKKLREEKAVWYKNFCEAMDLLGVGINESLAKLVKELEALKDEKGRKK